MKALVILVALFFSNPIWADTDPHIGDVLKCSVERSGIGYSEESPSDSPKNVTMKYSESGQEYRAEIGSFEVSVAAAREDGVLVASVFYGLMNSGAMLSSTTGWILINKDDDTDLGWLDFNGQTVRVTCSVKK